MPDPTPAACLSDADLVDLLEGRLDAAALARVEQHVAGCRACVDLVAGLSTREVRTGDTPRTLASVLAGAVLWPARSRIAGRFVIESLAGSGGMERRLPRAGDEQTGGVVALKLLQRSDDPEVAERFAREAKVLSELCHPGIVAYVAHGTTEAGAPYLAMEWLDGEDLAKRLSRGPLSVEEALVLLRRAADGRADPGRTRAVWSTGISSRATCSFAADRPTAWRCSTSAWREGARRRRR